MFTQVCFIRKNTKELREKLEKLGHSFLCRYSEEYIDRNNKLKGGNELMYNCIVSDLRRWYYAKPSVLSNRIKKYNYNAIDCGINEDLFLAIAALRDDSDYMQWFVCNEDHLTPLMNEYKKGDFQLCLAKKAKINKCRPEWHKATVKELIEHFKK
jgi:hypothetical protein